MAVALFHFVFVSIRRVAFAKTPNTSGRLETHPGFPENDVLLAHLRHASEQSIIGGILLEIPIHPFNISAIHVSTFRISSLQRVTEHRVTQVCEMGWMKSENKYVFNNGVSPPAAANTGKMSHLFSLRKAGSAFANQQSGLLQLWIQPLLMDQCH